MKKVWSQKIWLLGALMLPLAGCGSTGTTGTLDLPTDVNVGISVDDSASEVTVTKTVTAATATTPAKTTWAVGNAGKVSFVFTSRPGSDASYITKYRLTSDIINGRETITNPAAQPPEFMNVYVPSGYTCATASQSQSCDATLVTTVQGNGVASAPYLINLAGGLSDIVKATNASVYRTTTIEFSGTTSRGKTFTINTIADSRAYKAGDE